MPPPIRLPALRSPSRALRVLKPTSTSPRPSLPVLSHASRSLHTSPSPSPRRQAHSKFNEPVPDQAPPTDFARMDVLGQTPAPATSIDACLPDGFVLGDGSVTITGGSGALLVAGEAFAWRPWNSSSSSSSKKQLVNAKGQWDLDEQGLQTAFGLLGVVWPRPGMCPQTLSYSTPLVGGEAGGVYREQIYIRQRG